MEIKKIFKKEPTQAQVAQNEFTEMALEAARNGNSGDAKTLMQAATEAANQQKVIDEKKKNVSDTIVKATSVVALVGFSIAEEKYGLQAIYTFPKASIKYITDAFLRRR